MEGTILMTLFCLLGLNSIYCQTLSSPIADSNISGQDSTSARSKNDMNLQLPPVARPPNSLNSDTDRRMAEISSGVRSEFLRSDNTEASADQPNTTNSLSLSTANISSAADIVRYRLGEVAMQNNEPTNSSDVVNTTINDMSLNGTNNTTTNSDQSLKTIETLDQETTVNPTVTQQNNALNALGASTTIGNDMITVNRTEKIKTSTVAMEMHTNVAVNESAVLDIVSTTANTPAPVETKQSDSTPNSVAITITTGSALDASSATQSSIDLPSCMSISCPQKCPLGYSLDKNQCPTCNCKGISTVNNSEIAVNGSTTDASIDLTKIDARPILPSCMSIRCPQKCPLGYILDKNQCPTCNCKGSPVINSPPITVTNHSATDAPINITKIESRPIQPSCMSISCPHKCPLGYNLDKNQCPTCNCKVHRCQSGQTTGKQAVTCNLATSLCPQGQACEKIGTVAGVCCPRMFSKNCPTPQPGSRLLCLMQRRYQCGSDAECGPRRICCPGTCGSTCTRVSRRRSRLLNIMPSTNEL